MVAAFTYYKKCICSEGTSTTYAPGCPIHDPRMKAAFECSNCKRLEAENQRLINIAGDTLGFSEYQRDQDTVEVLAHHCKRLAEELAKQRDKIDALVKALSRVTAYYDGALHGVTTDNYQDVLDEANTALAAAKDK